MSFFEMDVKLFDREVDDALKEEASEGMEDAMENTLKDLEAMVNRGGQGPSRPGNPWKNHDGFTLDSIDWAVVEDAGKFTPVMGVLGSDEEHVLYLERGTNEMEPRPTLRPAVLKNAEDIIEMVTR